MKLVDKLLDLGRLQPGPNLSTYCFENAVITDVRESGRETTFWVEGKLGDQEIYKMLLRLFGHPIPDSDYRSEPIVSTVTSQPETVITLPATPSVVSQPGTHSAF